MISPKKKKNRPDSGHQSHKPALNNKLPPPLGQVLIKNGILTEEQLDHALNVQRDKLGHLGKAVHLGRVVVELGYATEEQIITVINTDYRITIKSLADDIRGRVSEQYKPLFERIYRPRFPIWIQLFVATVAIIILTALSLSLFMQKRQKEMLYRQTLQVGKLSLNYFSNNAKIPLLEDNILHLNTLIKDAPSAEGVLYAIIVDNQQIVKAHTDINQLDTSFKPFPEVARITHEEEVKYFNYFDENGRHILNLMRAIELKGKRLGEVHVGLSIDFIEELTRRERYSIVLITISVIFLGALVAVWLGLRFSKPISQLLKATQQIAEGNYRYKILLNRRDELGNLASSFNRMGEELWKKSLMQKSFGKYIGAEVLEMILANPEGTWLKGHRNTATTILLDIRGFTAFSESTDPEQIVAYLNEYFQIATQAIVKFGGYVDKFIGDAVLGVFGVPVYHQNHVERAVRAAIQMQETFQKADKTSNPLLGSVAVAINTGEVLAGNIGSKDRMEYTIIGDSVNVTSRLNTLAGAGEIIISKSVLTTLEPHLSVKELPPRRLKGRSALVEAYQLLEIKDSL